MFLSRSPWTERKPVSPRLMTRLWPTYKCDTMIFNYKLSLFHRRRKNAHSLLCLWMSFVSEMSQRYISLTFKKWSEEMGTVVDRVLSFPTITFWYAAWIACSVWQCCSHSFETQTFDHSTDNWKRSIKKNILLPHFLLSQEKYWLYYIAMMRVDMLIIKVYSRLV